MTLRIKSFAAYKKAYKKSIKDPEDFWDEQAMTFYWRKSWKKTLKWNFQEPSVKWFIGGKLNITENCL
ncbi:MAG TPA: acetyl-coenzyme A synthetase N-terminal domain-containing protein, partial [Saprospiraceae bacterium]|nr:acetyl-coenzyme A synthetase N-terminal domain-containing protein [Saprospiraceae bacterium]